MFLWMDARPFCLCKAIPWDGMVLSNEELAGWLIQGGLQNSGRDHSRHRCASPYPLTEMSKKKKKASSYVKYWIHINNVLLTKLENNKTIQVFNLNIDNDTPTYIWLLPLLAFPLHWCEQLPPTHSITNLLFICEARRLLQNDQNVGL